MADTPTRLGQILLARDAITEHQLELALEYQALHGQPVGLCLIDLGFIDQKTLNRALRRQSWLKPCAACLTCLCAPFTFSSCFASQALEEPFHDQWTEQHDPYTHWSNNLHLRSTQLVSIDMLRVAAEAAWGIYQGEPKVGEWQYSLSKQAFGNGYSVSMQVHF
ncbi:MAG: hypothetical protein HRU08_00785 [Oleispira sp.]|mgnify:CR=1 FL=1|nr:hypothetical protein [Oleispira sp.]